MIRIYNNIIFLYIIENMNTYVYMYIYIYISDISLQLTFHAQT